MVWLIRVVLGIAVFLLGGALLVRYSEATLLTHVGERAEVTVIGRCQQPELLGVRRAPQCAGTRGDSEVVVVGRASPAGAAVPSRVLLNRAYVRPDSAELVPGYAALPLLVLGFGMVVARPGSRTTT